MKGILEKDQKGNWHYYYQNDFGKLETNLTQYPMMNGIHNDLPKEDMIEIIEHLESKEGGHAVVPPGTEKSWKTLDADQWPSNWKSPKITRKQFEEQIIEDIMSDDKKSP